MPAVETNYANTDFVLHSAASLDALVAELRSTCHVCFYTHENAGPWCAQINASHGQETADRDAAMDIAAMLAAIGKLSPVAKAEFQNCDQRDFNIGFDCWDSWGYNHALPNDLLQAIAAAGCSLSVTLYPMRKPDGTPKV